MLLNRCFTNYPEDAKKVVLSIKGGLEHKGWSFATNATGWKSRRDYIKDIEEDYIKTGKIGGIALSEVSAATIERALKVTKIVSVEVELSLWSRDVLTNGIAQSCEKHNIPPIAYSPIDRGMFAGTYKTLDDVPGGGFRASQPRFSEDNFENNLKLAKELEKTAKRKISTLTQVGIAWVRNVLEKDGNPLIIPIPGATTEERIVENAKEVALDDRELTEIDSILKSFNVAGNPYGGLQEAHING